MSRARGVPECRAAHVLADQRPSTASALASSCRLAVLAGHGGQFMMYLPATGLFTLSASLLMALIFVPIIGHPVCSGRSRESSRWIRRSAGRYG